MEGVFGTYNGLQIFYFDSYGEFKFAVDVEKLSMEGENMIIIGELGKTLIRELKILN